MSPCDRTSDYFFVDLANAWACGIASVAGEARQTAVGVTGNASDAAQGVSRSFSNPFFGLGLGGGIALGTVVTALGIAVAIDVAVFKGAGTRSAALAIGLGR